MSDPAFRDVREKRYFQFFRQKTTVSTNRLMNSRFWDRIVLQMCHVEPAVKYAVLALSSLHRLSEERHQADVAVRHQQYADQNYQRALSAAQKLLNSSTPEDIDRVLIACLVLTCHDNVRGNYLASQMHTGSGRAILAQHHERLRSLSRRNDLNEIQQLFGRLDIAAMAFSLSNARYPYDIASFHATKPNLIPDAFESVEEARAPLVDHVRWGLICGQSMFEAILQDSSSSALPMLEMERLKVQHHLDRWSLQFDKIALRDPKASPILVRVLRIWHQLAAVHNAAGVYGSELRFDKFIDQYEYAVTLAEEVLGLLGRENTDINFSFDLGITIPLFEVVQRCRHPSIRRRALSAIRAGPKQEGVWGSSGAADTIEQWMLFEESGLAVLDKASDVPEWRRIVDVSATIDAEAGSAELIFAVTPSEGHESELALGFLGKICDGGEPATGAVRPFSMGSGNLMSYEARFDEEVAKVVAHKGTYFMPGKAAYLPMTLDAFQE